MYGLICENEITLIDGSPICSSGWFTQIVTLPFDPSQIDPATATLLYGGGFFLSLTPFAATWGIKAIISLIKSG